jgi:cyclohexa-1,5-dienecarbonyl-CoA hydratase
MLKVIQKGAHTPTSMASTKSTLASTRLNLKIDGPLARITFAHPPLNVFDFQLMDELLHALKSVEQRPEIAAIVLTGGERAFSAGVDVAVHTPDKISAMFEKFHGLILTLTRLTKITIAQVQGACLGGGAELAMLCDMCFTTRDAKWGFPEITLGCYPPVACTALAALVGEKRAADLIFTGRIIAGQEAADWGMANEACSHDALADAVQKRLEHLFKLSPAALAHAKKAFYAWDSIHLDKGLARAEKIYIEELMRTEDAKEGVDAWLQKRQPQWRGK